MSNADFITLILGFLSLLLLALYLRKAPPTTNFRRVLYVEFAGGPYLTNNPTPIFLNGTHWTPGQVHLRWDDEHGLLLNTPNHASNLTATTFKVYSGSISHLGPMIYWGIITGMDSPTPDRTDVRSYENLIAHGSN